MRFSVGSGACALSVAMLLGGATHADAFGTVSGHFKSNGTYVAPYVRSEPNGLKYDNYSWTPSQGLFNDTYGTRGSSWDTPTWITDPDYYTGLSLYNLGLPSHTSAYSYPSSYTDLYDSVYTTSSAQSSAFDYDQYSYTPTSNYETVYGGYRSFGLLFCNSGYYEKNDSCVAAPAHATAYGGYSFYCNYGYSKSGSICMDDDLNDSSNSYDYQYTPTTYYAPASAPLHPSVKCPEHAQQSLVDSSCVCDTGLQMNADKTACVTIVTASQGSNDFVCQSYYGMGSKWDGTVSTDNKVNCVCLTGYVYNKSKNACSTEIGGSITPYAGESDQSVGERFFMQNKTCVGLNGDQYGYCLSYAYNH